MLVWCSSNWTTIQSLACTPEPSCSTMSITFSIHSAVPITSPVLFQHLVHSANCLLRVSDMDTGSNWHCRAQSVWLARQIQSGCWHLVYWGCSRKYSGILIMQRKQEIQPENWSVSIYGLVSSILCSYSMQSSSGSVGRNIWPAFRRSRLSLDRHKMYACPI